MSLYSQGIQRLSQPVVFQKRRLVGTPAIVPRDFTITKNRMKKFMFREHGAYPEKAGPADNRVLVPVTKVKEALQIGEYWTHVIKQSGASRDVMGWWTRVYGSWQQSSVAGTYPPPEEMNRTLSLEQAYTFWELLSHLAIRLDNGHWSKSHVESSLDRALWALKRSSEENIINPIKKAARWTWGWLKWLVVGVLGIGVIWLLGQGSTSSTVRFE